MHSTRAESLELLGVARRWLHLAPLDEESLPGTLFTLAVVLPVDEGRAQPPTEAVTA